MPYVDRTTDLVLQFSCLMSFIACQFSAGRGIFVRYTKVSCSSTPVVKGSSCDTAPSRPILLLSSWSLVHLWVLKWAFQVLTNITKLRLCEELQNWRLF